MNTIDRERADLLKVTRDLLTQLVDEPYLRSRLEAEHSHSAVLWGRLVETGLVSALVSEDRGGAGLGPSHLAGVLHALGEHLAPEPYLETAVVAAPLLERLAETSEVADAWLRRVVDGDAVLAVRFTGRLEHDPDRVSHVDACDLLLTIDVSGSVRAHERADLRVEPVTSVDPLRPTAIVEPVGEGIDLGTDRDAADRAWRAALCGSACELAGVTRRLLSMTVDYVSVRHQFGRPVGSFQGVKHKLASVAVKADMAEAAAFAAFEGLQEATDSTAARVAASYVGDAAELANVESLQLHGGIGFTWEYGLHLWMKRAMSLGVAHGTPTEHRRWLARQLLASTSGATS